METRRIERLAIDGAELEFVRIPARRRDVPSLVFLHEGLGSTGLWRDVPESIAARTGAEAIVYSRRGNGFSTPVGGPRRPAYMHDEALMVLPQLLDALQVRETILVGHSDGGSIAIVFAAAHPQRVRGLILEAPHLFVEPISVESIAAIRTQYETTDLRERMSRHHAEADKTFYGWNDIWLAPEFADWNVEAHAARVSAPVLALQGVDDEYGTPAQIDAMAARALGPVDRILLARCGHAPHRDRRELVEAVIGDWIDDLLGAQR
ncbi:MAG TPA: alpha/beta hydrolase [Candidatus Baltobacteraceae bacterium]|nr:alpha/beta hydrolase [Candidatus Baltobacteraceae bacterium]